MDNLMDNNVTSELHDAANSNRTLYLNLVLYPRELILAYNIFLSVTIAFGVPGNLLVLIVFVKMKVTTSTDWFILFITVFDFLSSFVNVPVYLTFTNGNWQHYGNDAICRMHMYFSQVVVISSAFVNCGLAVERYLKVCRPHGVQLTRSGARNVCFLISFIAAMASIPSANIYTNKSGSCSPGKLGLAAFFYYIAVFMLFVSTIFVITVCYIKICRAIFRSESNVKAHQSRATKRCEPPIRSRDGLFNSTKIHPYTTSTSGSGNGATNSIRKGGTANTKQSDKSPCGNNTVLLELNELGENSTEASNKHSNTNVWATGMSKTTQHISNNLINTFVANKVNATYPVTSDTVREPNSTRYTITNQVSRQSARTTKISLLVCTIFIISWVIPLCCFILLQTVKTVAVIQFSLFGKMTYLLSTFTNPFLYTWLNIKFRQKLKRFIHCWK